VTTWSTACPDWASRLKAGKSIIPPPIFPEEAEEALAVFKTLHIADAAGSPTFGESCAEWVFDLVRSIFGAYDRESGRRLIKEWFVQVPKKNSKSTIAAGIMLTDLIRNWRRSAQSTILAPTVTISKNSFDPARDMCSSDLDPELAAAMQVQSHVKTITNRATDAMLKVLAAETDTVGGSKSGTILVDELWLFGKRADAESMMREATGGLLSRPEGMIVYLTTQSDEPPAGIYAQKLEYARDVRDGRIDDPTFCPIIYEFPKDMIDSEEYLDPKNFHIVNPNIGYSVDREELERLFKQAMADGKKESQRLFFAKHLNVQIGMSMMANRWPGADFWERCGVAKLNLAEILDSSDIVDVGLDGGGLDDLLGMSVLGRHRRTRKWRHWGHAWAHPIVLERRKSEAPKLLDFSKCGDLTIVDDIGDDVADVAEIVAAIHLRGILDKVGVDPAGLGGIIDALVAAGVPLDKIIGVSQGWRLTGAIKTAERKLAEGAVEHCDQPLMAWSVANGRQEPRGNAVVITKQASGTAKIDPLLAFINSVALMMLNPVGQPDVNSMLDDPVMG
jgi:phage terminase large subunit-like protein